MAKKSSEKPVVEGERTGLKSKLDAIVEQAVRALLDTPIEDVRAYLNTRGAVARMASARAKRREKRAAGQAVAPTKATAPKRAKKVVKAKAKTKAGKKPGRKVSKKSARE